VFSIRAVRPVYIRWPVSSDKYLPSDQRTQLLGNIWPHGRLLSRDQSDRAHVARSFLHYRNHRPTSVASGCSIKHSSIMHFHVAILRDRLNVTHNAPLATIETGTRRKRPVVFRSYLSPRAFNTYNVRLNVLLFPITESTAERWHFGFNRTQPPVVAFPRAVARYGKPPVVGGRHWSPVRIGSPRCNKINSQRDTVGGRGCRSRSHADYVFDRRSAYKRACARARALARPAWMYSTWCTPCRFSERTEWNIFRHSGDWRIASRPIHLNDSRTQVRPMFRHIDIVTRNA